MGGMLRSPAVLFVSLLATVCNLWSPLFAQRGAPDLTQAQEYTLGKVSSNDALGGNNDAVKVPAGATFTLLDIDGPGTIAHEWFTISSKTRTT